MRCGITGKVAFKSERGAQMRGAEILNEGNFRRKSPEQFRAYKCEFCGMYHLTGKILEENGTNPRLANKR